MYANTYDATLNVKNGFPVFSTLVEANHIQVREGRRVSRLLISLLLLCTTLYVEKENCIPRCLCIRLQKTEDVYATYKLTDEDLNEIHALARDPKIGAPLSCVDRLQSWPAHQYLSST